MRRIFMVLCTLICAPTAGVSASVDQFRDLDPTASYGVVWAPLESEELTSIASATEDVDDINAFLDMEDEGLIVIASITRFDRNQATLVYDSGFETQEFAGPGAQASRSCFEPIAYTVSNEGVASRHITVYGDKSSDVEYAPKCGSYPCTRTTKGSGTLYSPATVWTDFFWRSNWGTFNYWTTRSNYWFGWSVSLYSGNSSINYMERSCANNWTGITLSWQ